MQRAVTLSLFVAFSLLLALAFRTRAEEAPRRAALIDGTVVAPRSLAAPPGAPAARRPAR